MLAPHDTALCARDPSLPGLRLALDLDALRERLAARGFGLLGAPLTAVTIRYSPGARVIVGLRAGEGHAAELGYLHAWSGSPPKKARDDEHVCLLDDAQLLVCRWPTDLRLGNLQEAADGKRRRRLLAALGVSPAEDDGGPPIQVLSYRPERRAALHVGGARPCVVKLHRPAGFDRALARWQWLRSVDAVTTPELLGQSADHSAIALRWLPGTTLAAAMRDGAKTEAASRAAGRALAALHTAPTDGLESVSPTRIATAAADAADTLTVLAPEQSEAAAAIVRQVGARLATGPATAIHGDFHAKQVLLTDDDAAALLDLDDAVAGAPLEDLACFCAHLLRDEATERLAEGAAAADIAAFLAGYAEGSQAPPFDQAQLDDAMALSLVSMCAYPFRTRHPRWPGTIDRMLRRAARLARV